MLFGFAFNTKHFGQQFCLGLSIISPKHIPFTIGDNKSPPPCPKAGGRGMNVPYLHFKTCCFTLWEESCLCWYLTIVLVPVFVTVTISTQGRYCSSNFHLNRVSEVKMLNDLSIKKIFLDVQPLTAAKFGWSDHGEVLDGQLTETKRKNSFACC